MFPALLVIFLLSLPASTEFVEQYSCFRRELVSEIPAQIVEVQVDEAIPVSIDWRQRGAVTPVKSQGSCNSCWAFSVAAAVEGLHKIMMEPETQVSLSVQQLIDCDGGNKGCKGGVLDAAFEYIKNYGLSTDEAYPYQGIDSYCDLESSSHPAATIAGYIRVPPNNEMALQQAVARQPVAVAVDTSSQAFRKYTNGVFIGECGTNVNHAMTVVGYGVDSDGIKYWLLKNSWGEGWGESGYMRLRRDVMASEGKCGVAMYAYYPVA